MGRGASLTISSGQNVIIGAPSQWTSRKLLRGMTKLGKMFDRRSPIIYYLAPDYEKPSWGMGLLYRHVEILRQHGMEASVVHQKAAFRVSWLHHEAPIVYLDDVTFMPRPQDILVVPEVLATCQSVLQLGCRHFIFVQNSFLILNRAELAFSYSDLGYERAITIMPHLQTILGQFYGINASIIPPYVAPYSFCRAVRD